MEKTKKIESANVVANQAAAKAAAPTAKAAKVAKVAKEQPKEELKEEPKDNAQEQPQTAEQLQAEIEKKQKELQKKLQELEEKQKLNSNRSKFIETLDNLAEYEKELQEVDCFETNIFRVKFFAVENGYRESDIFSVSNVSVLLDLIEFMRERIKIKVADIEQQLLK